MSTATEFLKAPIEQLLGELTKGASQDTHDSLKIPQAVSWEKEINLLKKALLLIETLDSKAAILLEYFIPRRSKRIDVVVLANGIVFVLEFKNNTFDFDGKYKRCDLEQCEDYALDLRDFHKESKDRVIVPVLIDTSANRVGSFSELDDKVKSVRTVNSAKSLAEAIVNSIKKYGNPNPIDFKDWNNSPYEPTPTIIEAAQRLYAFHSVRDISTTGADRYNLTKTTDAVLRAIDYAKDNEKKVVIFVTGVPGSGKTLVGLNIAHDESIRSAGYNAAFLSRNYPLVTVLQQALSIDRAKREQRSNKETLREAQTKVQHVLSFKQQYHEHEEQIPHEEIVIFDEAQRAWNKEYMQKKSQNSSKPYTTSEPELIMDIMNRHTKWAAVIGLIGSGQEIHNGEAGLREWGNTIKARHKDWVVFASSEALNNQQLAVNQSLFDSIPNGIEIHKDQSLHLRTSIRSYKAALLSEWVSAVLDNAPDVARKLSSQLEEYPIIVSRDLQQSKKWVKHKCRGTRTLGLVCSSGAKRLRPLGIETEIEVDVAKWFLADKKDVRSSSFLEIPATEFEIQGLERDWICLAWDVDLTRNTNGWTYRDFSGTNWKDITKEIKREYLLNTYRVLLTRAREGLIIFVPRGDSEDPTRNPSLYDAIFTYLCQAGASSLE
jgi:hypothetical protein